MLCDVDHDRACGAVWAPLRGVLGGLTPLLDPLGRRSRALPQTIRQLTDGFAAPSDGCSTYVVCMGELADFERDLHRHVHLENNVLFPAAIRLESAPGLRL